MEFTKEMYACSYKEVMTILRFLSVQDLVKIPSEKLEFFDANMDENYDYELDYSKSFMDQKMSPITEAILANLYRDYLASPAQKQAILEKEKRELEKIEEEKRLKYNPDNLFKNRTLSNSLDESTEETSDIIVYNGNKNIFIKLLEKIKSIFKFW